MESIFEGRPATCQGFLPSLLICSGKGPSCRPPKGQVPVTHCVPATQSLCAKGGGRWGRLRACGQLPDTPCPGVH